MEISNKVLISIATKISKTCTPLYVYIYTAIGALIVGIGLYPTRL